MVFVHVCTVFSAKESAKRSYASSLAESGIVVFRRSPEDFADAEDDFEGQPE